MSFKRQINLMDSSQMVNQAVDDGIKWLNQNTIG